MLNKVRNTMRSKKGFTLVELIVVIAVLAILMAIAIPNFIGYTQKANRANDDALAAILQKHIMLSYANGDLVYVNSTTPTIVVTKTGSTLNFTPTTVSEKKAGGGTQALTAGNAKILMMSGVDENSTMKYYSKITFTMTGVANSQFPTVTITTEM